MYVLCLVLFACISCDMFCLMCIACKGAIQYLDQASKEQFHLRSQPMDMEEYQACEKSVFFQKPSDRVAASSYQERYGLKENDIEKEKQLAAKISEPMNCKTAIWEVMLRNDKITSFEEKRRAGGFY